MNTPEKIKPKSIRLAIINALASGEITTIDDLQIKVDEPRNKVANNVYQAVAEGFAKRIRDDVTGGPAYQITPAGRAYLKKYSSGVVQEPAPVGQEETTDITPGVKADIQSSQALSIDTLETVMPGFTAEVVAQKDEEIGKLNSTIEHLLQREQRLIEWEAMALAFRCTTPQDLANKFSDVAGRLADRSNTVVDPSFFVLQRPAKPLVRIGKIEKAKARALAFARSGQRVQVFALIPVGAAVPGSEWRSL